MSRSTRFKPKAYGHAKITLVCYGFGSVVGILLSLTETSWLIFIMGVMPMLIISFFLFRRITKKRSSLTINKDGIYYASIEKAHGVSFIPWSAVSGFKHFNYGTTRLLHDEEGDIVGSITSKDRANYIVIYFHDSEFKTKIKCSFFHWLIHGKSVLIDLNWLDCKSSDVKNSINARYINYLKKEAEKKKRASVA